MESRDWVQTCALPIWLDARKGGTRVTAGEPHRHAPVDVAAGHARRSTAEPFPLWLRASSALNVSLFVIKVLRLKTEIRQSAPGSPTRNSFKLEITFCVRGVLSPLLSNLVLDELDRELDDAVTALRVTPMIATSTWAASKRDSE